MIKNILKEIIIVLLLCVVITLLLGVMFYDYNPISQVVPSRIAYTTPENIAEELKTTNQTEEKELVPQNKVYTIDGSDLNLYKKSKAYDPSKENPFTNTTVESSTTSVSTSKVDTSDGNNGNSGSGENSGSTSTKQTEGTTTGSTSSGSESSSSSNQATGKKAKLK